MTSMSVVLPAPFGPTMQRSSPASSDRVSSSSARNPSKRTVTLSTSKSAVMAAAPDGPARPRPLGSATGPSGFDPVRRSLPTRLPRARARAANTSTIPPGRSNVTNTKSPPSTKSHAVGNVAVSQLFTPLTRRAPTHGSGQGAHGRPPRPRWRFPPSSTAASRSG